MLSLLVVHSEILFVYDGPPNLILAQVIRVFGVCAVGVGQGGSDGQAVCLVRRCGMGQCHRTRQVRTALLV